MERAECPSDARGAFAVLAGADWPRSSGLHPGHVASVRRHLIDILDLEQLAQLADIAERVDGALRRRERVRWGERRS